MQEVTGSIPVVSTIQNPVGSGRDFVFAEIYGFLHEMLRYILYLGAAIAKLRCDVVKYK